MNLYDNSFSTFTVIFWKIKKFWLSIDFPQVDFCLKNRFKKSFSLQNLKIITFRQLEIQDLENRIPDILIITYLDTRKHKQTSRLQYQDIWTPRHSNFPKTLEWPNFPNRGLVFPYSRPPISSKYQILEIPLLATIAAKVTFQKFQFTNDIHDKLFTIPTSYREDPTRFPDLWYWIFLGSTSLYIYIYSCAMVSPQRLRPLFSIAFIAFSCHLIPFFLHFMHPNDFTGSSIFVFITFFSSLKISQFSPKILNFWRILSDFWLKFRFGRVLGF